VNAYELSTTAGIVSLEIVDKPEPDPGPAQVLVRMRAASLNFRDLVVAKGGYGRNVKLPLVPLSDGAGEVVAVGEGVNRFTTGDRVAGIFMQSWLAGGFREEYGASAMGGAVDGVLAEYALFHQDGLVEVPAHLEWEEAATLPCAAVTAWHALFVAGGVQAGQTVLTMGSGGVSVFALQFARMAGAKVIATSGNLEKTERLHEMGAGQLVNYRETPNWGKVVRELAGGGGVDCVVEVGGAGTLEQSLRAIRGGGAISLIGVLAGPGDFNPNWIFMKAVRLQGIYVGSREMFENMNKAIEATQMRPVVDRVFPFAEAKTAMRYMESGAHFGKVVISIQ
jgi:NADPH:quinone reductase-like Zn-dependent oxidoreductase